MVKAGNKLEFHPIAGAPHFIWLDTKFQDEVGNTRIQFLQKSGY